MHPVRVIVDTNVLVSYLLVPASVPGRAVDKALSTSLLLASDPTLEELITVLDRPKFDRYITIEERSAFLTKYMRITEIIAITERLKICRDPHDNKFLDLAINGKADFLITGDNDLLALHPLEEVSILSPANFLLLREYD